MGQGGGLGNGKEGVVVVALIYTTNMLYIWRLYTLLECAIAWPMAPVLRGCVAPLACGGALAWMRRPIGQGIRGLIGS